MLKVTLIDIFVVLAAFIVLAVYACCVVAGRTDQMYESDKNDNDQNRR